METVIQRVRTTWTGQSRGGQGAARRGAVPVAFDLPPMGPPFVGPPFVAPPFVHEVEMHECDGFRPRCTTREGLPADGGAAGDGGVRLDEAGGLLRVLPAVTPYGAPRRWRRPPAVRLARGQWLRWQVNYRFGGGHADQWTYRLDTFNIAYGPVSPLLFRTVPTRHMDERAHLR
ncbi:hypothetical protein OG389_03980 [Streptomyces sp. NBC_00435]|uniref:hypothetical protein n=1 Tax=Streptomyces sp. NBC_00435 TaxID=2903649 RepID=UPI002E1FADC1